MDLWFANAKFLNRFSAIFVHFRRRKIIEDVFLVTFVFGKLESVRLRIVSICSSVFLEYGNPFPCSGSQLKSQVQHLHTTLFPPLFYLSTCQSKWLSRGISSSSIRTGGRRTYRRPRMNCLMSRHEPGRSGSALLGI